MISQEYSINQFKTRQILIIISFSTILFLSFIFAISFGSFDISIIDIIYKEIEEIERTVLFKFRFPRVLLACFVGSALSISGASLQGLFRNPLAEPSLIGVSAGAALGASLSIVLGNDLFPENISAFTLPLSAIIGSTIVTLILLTITKRFNYNNITYLLLSGIAINAFAGVGIGILTYISSESELRGITFWTMGSFGGASWEIILPSIIIIFITTIWIIRFSKELDIIQLGEDEAYRLGVDVKKLKINIILSSAVVVGTSVSLCGMIGFVGLVVPHLMRLLGGVNHKYLLIGSCLAGSSLMIMSDLICRISIPPSELPVGIITSAIGAPFFLWLISRMKKR